MTLLDGRGMGERFVLEAFEHVLGYPPQHSVEFSGRTDRDILIDLLTRNGIREPESHWEPMTAALIAVTRSNQEEFRRRAIRLSGAIEALESLKTLENVVQSVLTGNLRAVAEAKLTCVELDRYLDLDVGGYGADSAIRADLVDFARRRAEAKHHRSFAGSATVLIGDTPRDVRAATLSGARSVAVATGPFSADELRKAGGDLVLPNLSDTEQVVAAILGESPASAATPNI